MSTLFTSFSSEGHRTRTRFHATGTRRHRRAAKIFGGENGVVEYSRAPARLRRMEMLASGLYLNELKPVAFSVMQAPPLLFPSPKIIILSSIYARQLLLTLS
jgi:hypothetical protein